MRDPFEILGLHPDATDDQIRAAYRILLRRHHPDAHPQASEAERRRLQLEVEEITAAFRRLNDPSELERARRTQVRQDGGDRSPSADPSEARFDYRERAAIEFTVRGIVGAAEPVWRERRRWFRRR